MTTPYWKRVVIVQYGELVVQDLQLQIEVKREVGGAPASGYVRIYNLGADSRNRFNDDTQELSIQAGYEGNSGPIFTGGIHRVSWDRRGRDYVLEAALVDISAQPGAEGGLVELSYDTPTPLSAIVRDVADKMGLRIAGLSDVDLPDVDLPTWSFSGSGRKALTGLLSQYPVDWYVDDDELRFLGRRAQLDGPTITLSPETGLIDSPRPTRSPRGAGEGDDDPLSHGLTARSLLNYQARIGLAVTVSSAEYEGKYYIASLAHQGSNRGGKFETTMELKAVE